MSPLSHRDRRPWWKTSCVFFYSGPYGGMTLPQQFRWTVVNQVTPCCMVLIATSPRRQQVPRLDESFVHGVPGRSLRRTIALVKLVNYYSIFHDTSNAHVHHGRNDNPTKGRSGRYTRDVTKGKFHGSGRGVQYSIVLAVSHYEYQ